MPGKTLPLALLGALAFSVPAWAEDKPSADTKEPAYLATEPLESCVNRWDAGTHMSKEQWRETCKRISEERGTYLKKQGILPESK
jgi:hypothetical protein